MMGLESAAYINSLNSSWPDGAVDPRSEGDDHLRLIKTAVKASLPNITGAMTASHTELNYMVGVTSNVQTQLNTKEGTIGVLTIAKGGTGSGTGAVGGDLTGTLPNPTLVAAGPGATGPVGNGTTVPVVTIDAKGRVTGLSSTAISFPAVPVTSVNGHTGAVSLTGADYLLSPGAVGMWAYGAAGDAGGGCAVGSTTTAATCGGVGLTGTWKNMGPSTVGSNYPSNTTMLQRIS